MSWNGNWPLNPKVVGCMCLYTCMHIFKRHGGKGLTVLLLLDTGSLLCNQRERHLAANLHCWDTSDVVQLHYNYTVVYPKKLIIGRWPVFMILKVYISQNCMLWHAMSEQWKKQKEYRMDSHFWGLYWQTTNTYY